MFFILGYPRSRTTWLSCLLHDSSHPCFHEKSSEFSSFEEMEEWCEENPSSGMVDTLLITQYEKLFSITDKVVVIGRDPISAEISNLNNNISHLHSPLQRATKDERVKVFDYSYLFSKDGLRDLCEYLEIAFDKEKYEMLSECIITTNVDKFMDRVLSSGNDYNWLQV